MVNWILVVMALMGALCASSGSTKYVLASQAIWLVSNMGLAIHNIKQHDKQQTVLFSVYFIICAVGIYRWLPEVLK